MKDHFECNIESDKNEDQIQVRNKQINQLKMEIEKQVQLAQLDQIQQNAKNLNDEFEIDIISSDNKKNIPFSQNKDLNYCNVNRNQEFQNANQICNLRLNDQNNQTGIDTKQYKQEKIQQNIEQQYNSDNSSDNTNDVDSLDAQQNQPHYNDNQYKVENKDQKQAEKITDRAQKQAWLMKIRMKRHENQGEKNNNENLDVLEIINNGKKTESDLFEQGLFKRTDYNVQNTLEQKQFQLKKEQYKSDFERSQLQSNLNKSNQEQKQIDNLESTLMKKQQIKNNLVKDVSNQKELQQNLDVKKIFEKRFELQKDSWDVSKHIITSTENNIDQVKTPFQLQPINQLYQIINGPNQRTINSYFSPKNPLNQPHSFLQKQQGIDNTQIKQQNQNNKQEKHSFIQKCEDGSIKYNKDLGNSLKYNGKDQLNNQKKTNQQEIKQQQYPDLSLQKQLKLQEGVKKSLHQLDLKQQQQPQQLTQREKEKKKLEMQLQILDNPLIKQQGQKETEELLNEDKHELRSIKIEKKKVAESQRLSKFKMMLDSNTGESFQIGKPIFEFNRLLKYLFLKNYDIPDISDQEQKVIPNKFESAEEYCKIFEYLFLNEASAQIKQELIEFLKKTEKTNKYRKVQIKIDENDNESEGTIFVMRGPQTNQQQQDSQTDNKQQKRQDDNDQNQQENLQFNYDNIKDGVCDLTTHKNYIFIISTKIKIKLREINQLHGDNMIFFGILIDPQKAQYLQQIRIQSFVNKKSLDLNQWYNVFLFPFSKITTSIREYQMITKLNHKTPLANLIYNPTNSQSLIGSDIGGGWTVQFQNQIQNKELLDSFFQIADQKYNETQANSIKEIILKEKGICLLQGPPGTGKTHTLIGLLSGVYEYMKQMNKFPRKKILICAPSNAAIDEIILRILQKGGLFDSKGNSRQANVIRIGLLDEENVHSDIIKKVSLEDLAQHKLFSTQKFNAEQDQKTTADLRIELCQIQNHIKKLEKKLNQHGLPSDERKIIKDQINQFNDLRKSKQEYLDKTRENKKIYKEFYNQFCEKLLNDAEIICSTLSSSGSDKLSKYLDQIELLIVDEAAQCTEPSNIIPLRLGIQKMILIGDPKQLPATTFSPVSHQTLYNRSLFERILDNNFKPYFLDIQYRMHSEIRMFPSEYFYQNKLKDHESTNIRNLPINFFKNRVLFLDIIDGQEQKDGTSNINEQEALIIVQLIKSIKEEFPTQTIGVICAYKSQVRYIKTLLKQKYTDENFFDQTTITINTVDSFQGQEKDIILFSCVRSSQTGGIGFLNDGRRMNVALTRAKNALFILGNAITLSKSDLWKSMLKNIQQRQLYRNLESSQFQFQQVLKNEWNEENKTLSPKLLAYLNQTSQGNHEKSTYNISDFKIEITKNQKIDQKQDSEIKKQYNKNDVNDKESQQRFKIIVTNKEKDKSTSEYQISKQIIKNQESHNQQNQTIKNYKDDSKIQNNQFQNSKDIKAEQNNKYQINAQLQNKEHQSYEDFDLIRCLREEGFF
ncbi:unnamed protein product [Paramecium primaurelia]|uniref:UvrD-like helicase ATP-binding domain-containing protein n=1 Tax=Paramecium primaurelia TaxID=5886 RepID=A0A8S1K6F8_PARPR|nr:unnamed protein product [Paramecium primaurelia]